MNMAKQVAAGLVYTAPILCKNAKTASKLK